MKSTLDQETRRRVAARRFPAHATDTTSAAAAAPASLLITVVVPTRDRPELLRRCLTALLAQDFDPAGYEIVVADETPSVGTRRMVEDLAEAARALAQAEAAPASARSVGMPLTGSLETQPQGLAAEAGIAADWRRSPSEERAPRIRYIPLVQGRGAAAARNAGWRAARGQIVAFTEDDCVAAPDWLRAGVSAFDEHVVGVMGRTVVSGSCAPADRGDRASRLASDEFVSANCFYRREALAAVGGFDERFADVCREDTDLFFTLLRRGGKFVAAPASTVTYQVRPEPWGAGLREQRTSMYEALLFRKHPDLYQRRVHAKLPWRHYAAVAAALLALAGWLLAAPALALGGAAAWALLTARLCARRLRGASRAPSRVAEAIATAVLLPPLAVFWRLRGALRFRVFFL